jgi:spore coat protein H
MRNLLPALFLGWTVMAPGLAVADGPKAKAAGPGSDVFEPTKVWAFHLDVSAKDYEAMQPAGGGFFGGGPGGPGGPGFPGRPGGPPKAADPPADVHKGGSFGIEFPIVHAAFTAEGKTYKDIGLRYKGGGSYVMSASRLKRNFKVELDHFEEGQRFRGQKKVNLNAGTMDTTHAREALAFAVYRAAGIPAPRTAFAEVTLTVPGKYDNELLGLYTVVEQVDKAFLKSHFKDGGGLLLKPEVRMGNMRGPLSYQGDDWAPYQAALGPKREPTKAEAARVISFIKLVDRAPDEQFRRDIGSYLDVDEFLRFLAITALVANTDSFFTGGHNAYVYLDPATNKIVFIPWDMDLSFGGFFLLGPPEQQAELSLTHPYPGNHKLVDRLLAVPEMSERYQKILKELADNAFAKDKVLAELTTLEKVVKDPLARETKAVAARKENTGFGFGPPGGMPGRQLDLRTWIEKRSASVADQLAGKTKGFVPAGFGFGPPPGGPGGPRPRPGEVLPAPLRDALRLTNEQRRKFDELQKDVDRQVEQLLTEEQRTRLKRMREGGPPGGPGGPGPG